MLTMETKCAQSLQFCVNCRQLWKRGCETCLGTGQLCMIQLQTGLMGRLGGLRYLLTSTHQLDEEAVVGVRTDAAEASNTPLTHTHARHTLTDGSTLHTSECTRARRVFAVESGNLFNRLYSGCGMSGWRWGGGMVSSPDHTPTSPRMRVSRGRILEWNP